MRARPWLLAGAVGLAACASEGTGPTPPPPPPGPTGVIYMQAGFNAFDPLIRVDVISGGVTDLTVPDALSGSKRFLLNHGAVSPSRGVIAGANEGAGKSFLWSVSTGEVTFHGDPLPIQENWHVWSPSGNAVAFRRRRLDGAASPLALVVLDATRGVQDTVIQQVQAIGRTFSQIRWIGGDSLLIDWREPAGPEYRVLRLQTLEITPFTEVAHLGHSVPPSFSASGRFMTLLTYRDSIGPTGETIRLLSRRLRDRTTGHELEYEADLQSDLGAGSASIAFSPDEHFLATCENDSTIRILRLPAARPERRIVVPYCHRLSWSSGG